MRGIELLEWGKEKQFVQVLFGKVESVICCLLWLLDEKYQEGRTVQSTLNASGY